MTTADELLNEIDADLRRSPTQRVIYLEGKTDVEALFALLGAPRDRTDIHEGVLVRGLTDDGRAPGSGSGQVRRRVELASDSGRMHVFGVLDGDGRTLDELVTELGRPQSGPLFVWEAYCIENLLAQVTWPMQWGEAPVWREVLRSYAAYVALNRLHAELRERLRTLGLHKFQNPQADAPLLTGAEVQQALAADGHLLAGINVVAEFAAEVESYLREVEASAERGHMLLNGKWLVQHLAVSRAGLSGQRCRAVWCDAVRDRGGSTAVRDWWHRQIAT